MRRNGQQSCNRSIMRRHGANEKLPAIPGLLVSESGSQRPSVVGGWSVNPRHAVFRLVPDGVISPVENTFRYHHREGLEALLKPVSQVRILPGAPLFPQLISAFVIPLHKLVRLLVGAWSVSQ